MKYILIGFRKSTKKYKKYDGILKGDDGHLKYVPFGDNRYEQYKDITPLKLYQHLDHNDTKRLLLFQSRFGRMYEKTEKYSPLWFSWNYLW